jgi:hypothetical protein
MARVKVEMYPDCHDIVAHRRGVVRAVHQEAEKGAAVARGVLLAHRAEGHAEITIEQGITDAHVHLSDKPSESNKRKPAAAAIEFGNKYGGGGIKALQRAFRFR